MLALTFTGELCGTGRGGGDGRYGLSLQVSPVVLGDPMADGDPGTVDRVTRAFPGMGKFDVAAIEAAAREAWVGGV